MAFLGLLIVDIVSAAQITIDKKSLDFKNVRREDYSFNTLTISSDSDADFKVNYLITGSLKDSITISSNKQLILNKASPLTLDIEVRPSNVANGIYQGSLVFTFERLDGAEISNEKNSFLVNYNVEITDKIIKQAIVKGISVDDINIGSPIDINVQVENLGNIELRPNLILNFRKNNNLVKSYTLNSNEGVLSGREKTLNFQQTADDLGVGNYNLEVNVMLDNILLRQETVDFYIYEKNEPIRKVIFDRIENQNKIHVNDNLEIKAFIENKNIASLAMLKGKIFLDNEFITDFESIEVLAEQNKEAIAIANFKPLRTGVYKIQSYLEYGSRKTNEIESVFEAVPETQNLKEVPLSSNPILALVLMLIAVFVMVKINKRKKEKKKR